MHPRDLFALPSMQVVIFDEVFAFQLQLSSRERVANMPQLPTVLLLLRSVFLLLRPALLPMP
jgi:hypothetical protein